MIRPTFALMLAAAAGATVQPAIDLSASIIARSAIAAIPAPVLTGGWTGYSDTSAPEYGPAVRGPDFWLVEVVPGTMPAVTVVDDFEEASACFEAAFVHTPQPGAFPTCIGLDERAEARLAQYIVAPVDVSSPACVTAARAPTDTNVEACLGRPWWRR